MSFDLYFCRDDGTVPSASELIEYFKSVPNFQIKAERPAGFQAWYENEDTGVYFSFDYDTEEDYEELEDLIPAGFTFSNLTFNINYIRPSFFGLEAMPVVERVCKELDLFVVDPQDDYLGGNNQPKEAKGAELATCWRKHNQWATSALKEEEKLKFPKCYLPETKSIFWWKYMFNKKKIEQWIGERDIFVPGIFILRRKHTRKLYTAFVWAAPCAVVFPRCDLVIIHDPDADSHKKSTVMKYEEVMAQISLFLQSFDGPVPNLKLLAPELVEEIRPKFKTVGNNTTDNFTRLASDYFIDFEFSRRRRD